MCHNCWVDYGSPTVLPEGSDVALALIESIYAHPDGVTGGPLHAELDDWNIGGPWTPWEGDGTFPPGLMATAERLCELMRGWTVEERAAVLAASEGFVTT